MTVRQRVETTRALLVIGALIGIALVAAALASLSGTYGAALAVIAAVALLWWWRNVFSFGRVLLWMEEHRPELRFALASLVHEPNTPVRPVLERRVQSARFARPITQAWLRLVGLPLAFFLATAFVLRPLLARATSATGVFAPGSGSGRGIFGAGKFEAIVTSPRYARIPAQTIENPATLTALVGSDIRFTGSVTGRATMPARPTVVRLEQGGARRMVALVPRIDSAPRVVLELPARDTVLPAAVGAIRLTASARDDLGITSGWFELIVSSGSGGERFTFRTAVLGRASANGARDLSWNTLLRLDSLKLEPGDVVHLRAVARDANPASDAEAGSSETRTLRVFRVGESDSVSVETAPPPEVGKGELSQRMLIMMTEKLVAQRRLARAAVVSESRNIGSEQSKLRKRVGQIIFTRLTGEEQGEETGGDTTGAPVLNEDLKRALADTAAPGAALLRAAEAATGAGADNPLEEEEGGPIVGVNRPLLEAFNAMWEAERRLGVGEPREALPHMRAALAAIQRARAAERLYLRGKPPNIVLDIAKLRLTGKREGIDPVGRAPRGSLAAEELARRARFSGALELLAQGRNAAAAVDSLILLRVEVLADQTPLAAALETAIDDLRSGRDATGSLRAARRALIGEPSTARTDARWSGAW